MDSSHKCTVTNAEECFKGLSPDMDEWTDSWMWRQLTGFNDDPLSNYSAYVKDYLGCYLQNGESTY
jgi:hypothetical protein